MGILQRSVVCTVYQCVIRTKNATGKLVSGARLNYVEHIFRNMQEKPALLFRSEHVSVREVTWKELKQQTAAVASVLKKLGSSKEIASLLKSPIAFATCIWAS